MKTTSLGPFLGINNRLPDHALRVDKMRVKPGDWLRSANNVDIDDAGNIRRRAGTALVQAMSNAHSLQMISPTNGFIVRAAVLYAVTLPAYSEILLKVLVSNARMSYTRLGDSWYFSNGTDSGRIIDGAAYPLALLTPVTPALSGIGGSLEAGRYLISVSYFNAVTGEEGGISASGTYELSSVGGIRVALPAVLIGATNINIYLSAANGGVPALLASVATGTTTYDCIALANGRESSMRFEAPLPAGTLFIHNGRLCSFFANIVYVGLPFRPGYYLPAEGFIPFPNTISIAVSAQSGVYVASDKTYFIPGDLGNVNGPLVDVLPSGAVPGTAFTVPASSDVGWFGVNGFVMADTQGAAVEAISAAVDLVAPTSGTAVVMECDGFKRVVSCGWAMNLATKAATTYSDWAFTSTSDHYGTKVDGIYSLDAAGTAAATVGLGKQNFGSEEKKHLPAVYLGVDAITPMSLRVQAAGGVDYTYSARSSSADMQQQRVDPGRGLRANWFELTLLNTAGVAFTLANISFAPTATTRRI